MNGFSRVIAVAGIGLLSLATTAEAGRRDFNNGASYMGLDYQAQSAEFNSGANNGQEFSPSSVRFRSGTMYDENFGYEAHLAIGTDGEKIGNETVEVDSYYGFALRGQLPLAESVAVYGLAGLGWSSYSVENSGFGGGTQQKTDSDFVYGAGLALRMGRQVMLSAEWMSQLSNDDIDITTVNIGIARLF